MFNLLKVRKAQGYQTIRNIRTALPPEGFRGLPVIADKPCQEGCTRCTAVCPTGAIGLDPVSINLGGCLFCPECALVCPVEKISFTREARFAGGEYQSLTVSEVQSRPVVTASAQIKRLFGRSLKLRSVSAGGCNGCELELNALSNVNFDMGRFGIDFVASPRHADGVVLSGPLTQNMAYAFNETIRATPEPKIIVLAGACAIGGGVFAGSAALARSVLEGMKVDLYIPGCPVHPLTVINGFLDLLGKR